MSSRTLAPSSLSLCHLQHVTVYPLRQLPPNPKMAAAVPGITGRWQHPGARKEHRPIVFLFNNWENLPRRPAAYFPPRLAAMCRGPIDLISQCLSVLLSATRVITIWLIGLFWELRVFLRKALRTVPGIWFVLYKYLLLSSNGRNCITFLGVTNYRAGQRIDQLAWTSQDPPPGLGKGSLGSYGSS